MKKVKPENNTTSGWFSDLGIASVCSNWNDRNILEIDNNNKITLNGYSIPSPPNFIPKRHNITLTGGRIYLNGYEWDKENNKWKRSLRAIWYTGF